jgi:hypothetical protein
VGSATLAGAASVSGEDTCLHALNYLAGISKHTVCWAKRSWKVSCCVACSRACCIRCDVQLT